MVDRPSVPLLILPPLVLTAILWATHLTPVSPFQAALGLALAYFPWVTYLHWKRSSDTGFPLLTAVSFVYWLFYAVPLFWGDRLSLRIGAVSYVTDSSVTQSMIMAVLGVSALWVGYRSGLGRRFRLPPFVDLQPEPGSLVYVRWVLVLSGLFGLALNVGLQAPDSIRQILLTLQLYVPLIAYAILLRGLLRGSGSRIDLALIFGYIAAGIGSGLYQGQLGLLVGPILATLVIYVWERRKLPVLPILIGLSLVLFFEPTKNVYRKAYGIGGVIPVGPVESGSPLDRVSNWFSISASTWKAAAEDPSSGAGLALLRLSIQRTSLLTTTAHVLDWTPSVVPFQNGGTYGYLIAGLVPRFLWPDKPSYNDANRFYQLAYQLSTPETLSSVSFSAGSMTEAYFNFGWPGVVAIMLLLGIVFDFVAASFLTAEAGRFLGAIGVVITLQFCVIESQLAVYLSGIIQTGLFAMLVFYPVLRFGRPGRASS
jgi:hypothetical protein